MECQDLSPYARAFCGIAPNVELGDELPEPATDQDSVTAHHKEVVNLNRDQIIRDYHSYRRYENMSEDYGVPRVYLIACIHKWVKQGETVARSKESPYNKKVREHIIGFYNEKGELPSPKYLRDVFPDLTSNRAYDQLRKAKVKLDIV